VLKANKLLFALCSTAIVVQAMAASAKPPRTLLTVECSVLAQQIRNGLALQVKFDSSASTPTRLSSEPHFALYRDSEAKLQMGITVRADTFKVQEVVVPANGSAIVEYRVEPVLLESLRCNADEPRAAALIFRSQSDSTGPERCVLRSFSGDSIPMNRECPGGRPLTADGKSQ
jgi:hypothetical protein